MTTGNFIIISKVSEPVFHRLLWTDAQMSARGFGNWFNNVRSDIHKGRPRSFVTGLNAKITGFDRTLFKGSAFKDSLGRNLIAKITGSDHSAFIELDIEALALMTSDEEG
ncbi:hypothetical protein JXO59_06600 [candidate division KSB1 bacterium]|nr:hypothetical protein [candidate division KSB1 bacterium]